MITTTATATRPGTTFVAAGHDARNGFCPVCGTVAPCYRARRAARTASPASRGH